MKGNNIICMNDCHDCKYRNGYACTHEYSEDCEHCELYTPKWYDAERKRLTELIYNSPPEYQKGAEGVADYLLENGVVVPPCKVGQNIYRISNNRKEVYGAWEIVKIAIYAEEMGFVDDSDNWIAFDDIGKTVFLTKEEAEQALKGGEGK